LFRVLFCSGHCSFFLIFRGILHQRTTFITQNLTPASTQSRGNGKAASGWYDVLVKESRLAPPAEHTQNARTPPTWPVPLRGPALGGERAPRIDYRGGGVSNPFLALERCHAYRRTEALFPAAERAPGACSHHVWCLHQALCHLCCHLQPLYTPAVTTVIVAAARSFVGKGLIA
jgi:hypothetical protein